MEIYKDSGIYKSPSIYESGAGGGGGSGLTEDEIVIGQQVFKTVKINDQLWTKKNFDSVVNGIIYNANGDGPYCWYYSQDPSSYGIYGEDRGMLYTHKTQIIIQNWLNENLPGWRIPTKNDWDKLINFAGGPNVSSLHKLGKPEFWQDDPSLFTDEFDLGLIPTGRKYNGQYEALNLAGFFWTSTPFNRGCIICYCEERIGISTTLTMSTTYDAISYRFVKDA